jgi:hypothetical protein
MPARDSQFRILYRQFAFRIVDLELLSSLGDTSKLLGQSVAFLSALSFMFAWASLRLLDGSMTEQASLMAAWSGIHSLISTTMTVVGLVTVLFWDSTFPDRRDLLILAPLPVRKRDLLLAKLAALGSVIGLAIISTNVFASLTYPFALRSTHSGLFVIVRSFLSYWLTMIVSGGFVLAAVLAVQGVAAHLLPRRHFVRLSAALQLAAFCFLLGIYFLQPSPPLTTHEALTDQANQPLLTILPSYWFLALFHALNGSMNAALAPLLYRAVVGIAVTGFAAIAAVFLYHFRVLGRIVEEPEIVPALRSTHFKPHFGGRLKTGVVSFAVKTLLRSRQHRVILAGYFGVGLAIALAYMHALVAGETARSWNQVGEPLLAGSLVIMCFSVVGMRAVYTLPISLRANWIFRVTEVHGVAEYLAAIRQSLLVMVVAPIWGVSALVFLWIWPLPSAVAHLVVLALLGLLLSDLCLHGFLKIPFTCAYLPGKASVHVRAGAFAFVLLGITDIGVQYELRALHGDPSRIFIILLTMGAAALLARRLNVAWARSPEIALKFDELPSPRIFGLELHRDGVLLTDQSRDKQRTTYRGGPGTDCPL